MKKVVDEKTIEWAGSLLGLIGAGLLALNNAYSGYGFVAFFISNLFWIGWGIKRKAFGLLTMQAGFTLTSIVGITNWLA